MGKNNEYLEISKQIVANIGGMDNIQGTAHCATRLRIVLKDNDLADIEKLEDIDKVKGAFIAGNQLQLILGAGTVNDVYEVFAEYTNTQNMSLGDLKEESAKRQNPLQAVIKALSDVFIGIMPALLAAALLMGITSVLVGPAGRILSNGITDGLMWSTEHLGAFGYALFAGVQQIVVITGLHHIIGAVEAQLIASTGTNFLNPLMSVALFGQSGAVLGYLSLNWKNLKARELCIPSFCSTLFGISEPAIFGVNLRYKFPLIGGCIGGAVAGAYVYYSKLTALGFGTTALPGMAIANPAHHGYINYIIAHAIAITIGFVCTVIFGKMWSAPDKNKNDKKNDTKENDTTKAVITEEPGAVYAAAEGTVKDIEASTDPTFANKVLGDGVVIFPEDGTVMAPCKATVSLVYPTGHAIGLTTADGAEILIHCGVDTVNMNGEGFETLVKEGQEVTAEEALIRFDIDLVKKHGYSPEILVIFTELPEGKTIKTEEKHIAKNDKMAEIV